MHAVDYSARLTDAATLQLAPKSSGYWHGRLFANLAIFWMENARCSDAEIAAQHKRAELCGLGFHVARAFGGRTTCARASHRTENLHAPTLWGPVRGHSTGDHAAVADFPCLGFLHKDEEWRGQQFLIAETLQPVYSNKQGLREAGDSKKRVRSVQV
jgi:hypothetical protein